eukprot:COSAG06_NODE_7992_length_2308_cov_4.414667_1_plen_106_part_00
MPAGPALLLRKARALLDRKGKKGEIGELTAKQAAAGVCCLARSMVDKPAGVDTVLRRPDGWAWLLSSLQVHVMDSNMRDWAAAHVGACWCLSLLVGGVYHHVAST